MDDLPQPSVLGADKSRYALDLLTATALKPPFGFDIRDAVDLWAGQVKDFSLETIERAVIEWMKEPDGEWPTMGEFKTVCEMAERHLRREAAERRGMEHPRADQACPECAEEGAETPYELRPGTVPIEDGGTGVGTSRPCSTCRPDQHRLWAAGCFAPKHMPCATCRNTNLWPAHMRGSR